MGVCSHSAHLVVPFRSAGRARFVVGQVLELVALLSFGFRLRSSAHIMYTASYLDVYYIVLVDAFVTPARSPAGVTVLLHA